MLIAQYPNHVPNTVNVWEAIACQAQLVLRDGVGGLILTH